MDPQKCTIGGPLREDTALEEPEASSLARSCLINLTRNVVVFRRIRWGNPISGVLLHLVTYKIDEAIEKGRTK